MELEIFELGIDEADFSGGISAISIVDNPAIEENYQVFNSHFKFNLDSDRKIISGPAMIPEKLIYRNENGKEFFVKFSAETIQKMCERYMSNGNNTKVNVMHTSAIAVDSFVFESFISDKSRGVNPMKGFENLPDGTWFISVKINCDKTWAAIKDNTLRGFSVEGFFGQFFTASVLFNEMKLKDLFKQFSEDINKHLNGEPIKAAEDMPKFTDITGKVYEGKPEIGEKVTLEGEPFTGQIEIEGGNMVVCADGVVINVHNPIEGDTNTEIAELKAELAEQKEAFSTLQNELTTTKHEFQSALKIFAKLSEQIQHLEDEPKKVEPQKSSVFEKKLAALKNMPK